MKGSTIAIIIIVALVVLLILYVITTYNRYVRLKNKVKEAFATMDVYLKKRWDMIPNIVETVKGYAKHEQETLESVIAMRNSGSYDSMNENEKIKENQEISKGINKIMVLAESYPELKANENFVNLQNELSSIEEQIAVSRKYYNAVVRDYNNAIEVIPSCIIANMFGFKTMNSYEAASEERENVKVSF